MYNKKCLFAVLLYVFSFQVTDTTAFYETSILCAVRERHQINFQEPKLSFKFDIENFHTDSSSTNKAEVILSEIKLEFSGFVGSKRTTNDFVNLNFNVKPITISIKEVENYYNCTLNYLNIFSESLGLHDQLSNSIKELVEFCISTFVCEQFDDSPDNDYLQNTSIATSFPESSPKSSNSCTTDYNPQKTINDFVDYGLFVVINKFLTNNNGVLEIPEIYHELSKGFPFNIIKGQIVAKNGTFKGLTSLKRKGDIILKNDKLRFSIYLSYELPKGELTFEHYAVEFLVGGVEGSLIADMEGVALRIVVVFDFIDLHCKAYMTEYNISLKKFNIYLTGFNIVNGLLSKFISWVVKMKLQTWSHDLISNMLSNLNCGVLGF